MEDVLARSSNIGAINIGLKVGDANLYAYLRRFGFGKRTDLAPRRIGRDAATAQALAEELDRLGGHGTRNQRHQRSVGAGLLGDRQRRVLVKPKLVLGAKTDPPVRIIRPETAITMRHMMEGVVIKPYGTGFRYARIPGYSSGGKTGTAQIYDFKAHVYTHLYNASFMGFAPVNDPAVVVVVTVNGTTGTAGYGGPVSAPVFREVAAAALRLMDVPKDLRTNLSRRSRRQRPTKTMWPSPIWHLDVPEAAGPGRCLGPAGLFTGLPSAGPEVPNFLGKDQARSGRAVRRKGVPIDFEGSRHRPLSISASRFTAFLGSARPGEVRPAS